MLSGYRMSIGMPELFAVWCEEAEYGDKRYFLSPNAYTTGSFPVSGNEASK
ncbi:hypothetical protein BRE01_19860 [Brevibacillus reuszeri]|uniref:Uncharacterized protein n=1 Tax=Brevibacillus reuszeri TaxID=54915 RepID=A0ABQ0TK72_9BACL|nr:hypothetical protein BRE01_19860 [Brevibacillus reuszeri]